ncbi:MAG: DUF167 domain-containing protein [Candidatus Komeilibacteria bacterium]|nr:DUF167 domain-containing protein [Candidatus Komeilibacteria bacterium]
MKIKVKVKVIAGAKKKAIEQLPDGGLKVHLTAVREKNKANQQLIELLAEHYGVAKSRVEIIKGKLASQKVLEIIK